MNKRHWKITTVAFCAALLLGVGVAGVVWLDSKGNINWEKLWGATLDSDATAVSIPPVRDNGDPHLNNADKAIRGVLDVLSQATNTGQTVYRKRASTNLQKAIDDIYAGAHYARMYPHNQALPATASPITLVTVTPSPTLYVNWGPDIGRVMPSLVTALDELQHASAEDMGGYIDGAQADIYRAMAELTSEVKFAILRAGGKPWDATAPELDPLMRPSAYRRPLFGGGHSLNPADVAATFGALDGAMAALHAASSHNRYPVLMDLTQVIADANASMLFSDAAPGVAPPAPFPPAAAADITRLSLSAEQDSFSPALAAAFRFLEDADASLQRLNAAKTKPDPYLDKAINDVQQALADDYTGMETGQVLLKNISAPPPPAPLPPPPRDDWLTETLERMRNTFSKP